MPAAEPTRSLRPASAQAKGALILSVPPQKLPRKITGSERECVVVGGNGWRPTRTNGESGHRGTAIFSVCPIELIRACSGQLFDVKKHPKKRDEFGAQGGIGGLKGPLADDLGRGDRRSAGLGETLARGHGGEG